MYTLLFKVVVLNLSDNTAKWHIYGVMLRADEECKNVAHYTIRLAFCPSFSETVLVFNAWPGVPTGYSVCSS